jgi:histidine triad (HIT) family protein
MNPNLENMTPEEILELQKKNCIFCKIINKEIPSQEVYSDDKVMVILDINPANEGHCLILPKEHYQILPQIPDDLIGYLFVIAKKTSRTLLKGLGVKGTTIFVANGALAGQKAPHFMIHVIPRKSDDMLFQIPKNTVDEKQLNEIQGKLSARISASTGRKVPLPESPKQELNETKKEETVEAKEENVSKKEEKHQKKEPNDKPINIDDISKLFI